MVQLGIARLSRLARQFVENTALAEVPLYQIHPAISLMIRKLALTYDKNHLADEGTEYAFARLKSCRSA